MGSVVGVSAATAAANFRKLYRYLQEKTAQGLCRRVDYHFSEVKGHGVVIQVYGVGVRHWDEVLYVECAKIHSSATITETLCSDDPEKYDVCILTHSHPKHFVKAYIEGP